MRKKFPLTLLAFGLAVLASATTSWACAVCLGGDSDSVTDGFNASVLFLMSTPYLVIGSIVGTLIFSYRRALKRREQAENAEAAEPVGPLAWNQEEKGR